MPKKTWEELEQARLICSQNRTRYGGVAGLLQAKLCLLDDVVSTSSCLSSVCHSRVGRYLELTCLQDTLQEIVDDFSATQSDEASCSEGKSELWCKPEVYRALQASLAVSDQN